MGLKSLPFGYAQGRLSLGMTEHPPFPHSPVFTISTIEGKPALPVNFAPAFTAPCSLTPAPCPVLAVLRYMPQIFMGMSL